MVTRPQVLLGILCLACTTAPQEETASTARRFDALLRYVPPGMEGVLFLDLAHEGIPPEVRENLQEGDGEDPSAPLEERAIGRARPLRAVLSGRKFAMRGVGGGDLEGVTVYECANDLDALGDWVGKQAGVRKETVAGHEVWGTVSKSEEGPLEVWVAAPLKRVLLRAGLKTLPGSGWLRRHRASSGRLRRILAQIRLVGLPCPTVPRSASGRRPGFETGS